MYQGNAVPCLLLITERHYVQACFLPPAIPKIRVLKASLLQQQYGTETLSNDVVDQRIGRRLCTHASIGLSYNGMLHGYLPAIDFSMGCQNNLLLLLLDLSYNRHLTWPLRR